MTRWYKLKTPIDKDDEKMLDLIKSKRMIYKYHHPYARIHKDISMKYKGPGPYIFWRLLGNCVEFDTVHEKKRKIK